jgi:holin-like protein
MRVERRIFLHFKGLFFLFLQIILLIILNKIGFFIVEHTHLPIPGNVMGMLVLFLLLCTGVIRLEWIEKASLLLIKHLSFFFIPISVGLMTLGSLFIENGIFLLIALLISTLLGIVVSGKSSQTLLSRKEAVHSEQQHHHHF